MKVAVYTRVSTDEQALHGTSLDVQRAQAQAMAERAGHAVLMVLLDAGVSGQVPLERRPAGRELLRALAAGEVEGVAVVALDRLFRSVLDGVSFMRDTDAQILSCREVIDTSTPQGRFAFNMTLAAAQYERDLASQRARDNARGLRAAGRVFGTVPYGCLALGGRLYRDPITWPQREAIVAMRARPVSFETIRQTLRTSGVLSPTGERWWSKSTLSTLVRTHDDLMHLPELDVQAGTARPLTPDGDVSHGSDFGHKATTDDRL